MSDNEFFFDDEQKAEPAAKSKAAPAGAVKKKPAPKSPARPVAAPARSAAVEPQSVTITIAVLIAVVALLVGMIAGIFIGRAMVPEVVSNPTETTGTPMGGGMGTAPALTDEQIQAGVMPDGHPDPASAETTPAQ